MAMYQHADATYQAMKKNLVDHVRGLFPIPGQVHRLELKSLEVKDNLDENDLPGQKTARMAGRTWSVPMVAELELRDQGGKTIDRARMKIIDVPRLTNRGSYIVGGSEYMFPFQKRLKPGAYVRVGQNDELKTFFNLGRGRNFHLGIHPEKGYFQFQVESTKNLPLYPILRALDVSDDDMVRAWGREAFAQNRIDNPKTLSQVVEKMSYGQQTDPGALKAIFDATAIDPDNAKLTLGLKTDKVTGQALLAASAKMLKVGRGEVKEDNRDSLVHNDIVDLSDYVVERFNDPAFRGKIVRNIKFNLDRKTKIADIISRDAFQRPLDSMFTQSELSQSPSQTNPLGMIADYTKITVRGEGGIQESNALTKSLRALDPSHLGFLDPAHTPEGQSVGTDLHLAMATRKRGRDLVTKVWNLKTGKIVEITPLEFWNSTVAFPESCDPVTGRLRPGAKFKATRAGVITQYPASQITHALVAPEYMLDTNTNAIPFVSHTNGTRTMMASKQGVAAKSLIDPDVPMIQCATPTGTVEKAIGNAFATRSPAAGRVDKVADDHIIVAGQKVPLAHYFPLNNHNFIHARPLVKVGDKVAKGQVIADTNHTKNGILALGKNLLTAYVPYKGMNVEDGVVISQSAAQKMTSQHLYQMPYGHDTDTVLDLKKFRAYFPAKVTDDMAGKLDEKGVVKKGQVLKPGDIMVAAMRRQPMGTESQRMARISKILAREFRDDSMTWDKGVEGLVQDVSFRGREIVIFVLTQEAMRVGDKLVGRHANKGIVVSVVPDPEMPKDSKGRTLDLLLNPNGVVSRMNLSQILETTAGRVAEKTKKPFIIKGFGQDSTKLVARELKKNGLKDHETIYDPVDNKHIPGILVGPQYIYKLEQQAAKKMSARGGGPDEVYTSEQQPVSGKEGGRAIGSMELYALLANGALANVHEMYTHKSQFDPEVWRAVESGAPLPQPKASYSQQRLTAMLRGMGVDFKTTPGQEVAMVPFLDRHIKEISHGEITDHKLLRGKDLKEEPRGLFDTKITGGVRGDRWSHVVLAEPLPNPTFEDAILSLTRLKKDDFDQIMAGQKKVSGLSGGKAIKFLLDTIDVKKRLAAAEKEIVGKKGSELNALHREIRYLRVLRDQGLKPGDYVITMVPVIPPQFRPVYTLPDGSLNVSDVNFHYQALMQLNQQMKGMKGKAFSDQKLTPTLYKAVGGIMGLNDGIVERARKPKGLAETIAGTQSPKSGYFQEHVLKKRQDVSATNVIIPNPKLGLDEIGVPEEMAWKTFRPFVIRELRSLGLTPLAAAKAIDDRTPQARQALERVVAHRHVIINRAPTLHKFSVTALKPRLTSGYALEIPPMIVGGLNADFDGDHQIGSVFMHIEDCGLTNDELLFIFGVKPEQRLGDKMTSRFKELVGYQHNGHFYMCALEDFPHFPEAVVKDHISFHGVPKGIRVIAHDHDRLVLAPVTGWSKHVDRVVEIVTLSSGLQIVTDDDERAVYGIDDTLNMTRKRPSESLGIFAPVVHALDFQNSNTSIQVKGAKRMKSEVALDVDFGHLCGLMCGDGWVIYAHGQEKGICLAAEDSGVRSCFERDLLSVFSEVPTISPAGHTGGEFGDNVVSKRYSVNCVELGKFMAPIVGRGAENKHLPPFFLTTSREFKLGLLAGLMDTGGSISISRAKKNPQWMINFSSISLRLVRELQYLCRSLGIRTHITPTKTPRGGPCWMLNFSTVDFHTLKDLPVAHENKHDLLKKFFSSLQPSKKQAYAAMDVIPTPSCVGDVLRKEIGNKLGNSIYQILYQSKHRGYISRYSAEEILAKATFVDFNREPLRRWREIVVNNNIWWDKVEKFERTDQVATGYDLTVPGHETFMSLDGVILSNTMGIHVPLTEEANAEAAKMLPSRNLYKPGSGKLQQKIEHEYVLGLYKISVESQAPARRFKNIADVLAAKLDPSTPIVVTGLGRTTTGRIMINDAVPKALRDYDTVWTEKALLKKLEEIDKKAGRDAFVHTLQTWADLGRKYAYFTGSSFLLSDLQTMTGKRDAVYRVADRLADKVAKKSGRADDKDKKIVDVYMTASSALESKINLKQNSAGKSNNIMDMMMSGARGDKKQIRQMVSNVGVLLDHENKPMTTPVKGTYAEGLDSAEFFQHMYSSRKGMIDRSQSVKDPGALTKQIIVSAAGHRVSMTDCGTRRGIMESGPAALDRYLAETVPGVGDRDTLVTPRVLAQARGKPLKVRSPLTCQAASGVCAKCHGLDEEGRIPKIGEFVGIKETQGLTEPSTQLAMKCNADGNLVSVRRNGIISTLTLEQLWESTTSFTEVDDFGVETKIPLNTEVWDHTQFVAISSIQRHRPDAKMMFTSLDDGSAFISQSNHPNWAKEHVIECPVCGKETSAHFVGHGSKSTTVSCDKCGKSFSTTREKYLLQQERIVETKDLLGHYLPVSTLPEGESGIFAFPPYLLGMALAEGCVSRRRNKTIKAGQKKRQIVGQGFGRYVTGFSFTQNKGKIYDRIESELKNAGIDYKTPSHKVIQVGDIKLGKMMWNTCAVGSAHKRLPPGWDGMSREWKKLLLAGLLDGDGGVGKYWDTYFDTTSWALASQISMLARGLGYRTRIHTTPKRKLTKNQGYKVAIYLTEKLPSIKKFKFRAAKPRKKSSYCPVVKNIEILDYRGFVYDLGTASRSFTVNGIRTHNSFHSGGVASGKKSLNTSFDKVKKLFGMPDQIHDNAILAEVGGRVSAIHDLPAGGCVITVEGKEHRVPRLRRPTVKIGDRVEKGQKITDGDAKPQDVLRLLGLQTMQRQLRDDIHRVYAESGSPISHKTIETPVRLLTEVVRIHDSGDNPGYVIGDYSTYGKVDAWNRENPGKKPVRYTHVLQGAEYLPHRGDDWAKRMAHNRITQVLTQAPAMGSKSKLQGESPFSTLVFGQRIQQDPWTPRGVTNG